MKLPFLKKKEEKTEEQAVEIPGEDKSVGADVTKNTASIIKISTEIDRLKASVEGLTEVRQSFSERFNRISEQIGELRAMILDRDRMIQGIELKAVKAADLVESVQPDKLMIELQKQDAKLEALKAGLESNEAIMSRVMDELKDVRRKVTFFKGVDEIVKLGEEVKKELIDIKRTEASIKIHGDKIDTMYGEIKKKYRNIDEFHEVLEDHGISIDQTVKDISFLKAKALELASKEEVEKLVEKVQKYIAVLKDLEKKSGMAKDLENLKFILESMK